MTPGDAQERIHDTLVTLASEEGVLTAWVVVLEHHHPDGEMSLSVVHGPSGVPSWRRAGMLHECLYGDWED